MAGMKSTSLAMLVISLFLTSGCTHILEERIDGGPYPAFNGTPLELGLRDGTPGLTRIGRIVVGGSRSGAITAAANRGASAVKVRKEIRKMDQPVYEYSRDSSGATTQRQIGTRQVDATVYIVEMYRKSSMQ